MTHGTDPAETFQPRFPHLTALLCTTVFVLVLCLPMFTGHFLIGPDSDQYNGGYAFRAFFTDYVRAHGAVPQWDPYIFGGLPFIAATHGDTFHPIVLLRLIMPTDMAMNGSFLIHLVLAGFFAYLFLRGYGLPWAAAVVGGVAYQLTGQVASLVNSGHDGKIIVSALLPLALLGLVRWIRDGRWSGFALLGFAIGLAILSPQLQMAYYLMLASGLFALYLAFFDPDRPTRRIAVRRLAGSLAAVLLGGAVAAVQVLPFLQYIPFSPRAAAGESTGWAHATSWAMPPEELLDTLLPQFSGLREHYTGSNFFKHHSEYLGVGTLILASIGLTATTRSRLRWAFVGLAAFFLTFALAGATPFFRLWFALLPMVSKARAHSMAFYLVSFAVAVWAALGVERLLQRDHRQRVVIAWSVALGVLLLGAAAGIFTNIERTIAAAAGQVLGDPERGARAMANQSALFLGALRIAAFGAATLAVLWAWGRGRLRPVAFAALLIGLVGGDLYTLDREFFVFSPRAAELFAPDAITERINTTAKPFRVLDLPQAPTYAGSNLMLYGIPQVLGYHSFQIRYYDDLLGGKNEWRYLLSSLHLWKLLAIRYVVVPDTVRIPGFHRVLGPVPASSGRTAYLYEADTVPAYARVVPAALKADSDQIAPTLVDPRLDFDRIVLLDRAQPVSPPPVTQMPEASPSRASVTAWEAGRMRVAIDPSPPVPSYVVVAENWYLDWHATVDGVAAPVLRGDQSLITVPVPAGAKQVDLVFRSSRYGTGIVVSILATLILAGCAVAPTVTGRMRQGRVGG